MFGLQLVSEVTASATVVLRIVEVDVPQPAPDEVTIRVDATPINPSDIGLMFAGADPHSFVRQPCGDASVAIAPLRDKAIETMAARVGRRLTVGNEGAGIVVEAGSAARHLIGRTVAVLAGGMYAQYRTVPAADCIVFPDGADPVEAASACVNPLTALGMTHTMKAEGHTGIVHSAAASSLGHILNRICKADDIPLVNIVRNQTQVDLLHALGAEWVVNTSAPDFPDQLGRAVRATRATIAFDAVGGGNLVGQILNAMENVFGPELPHFSRYGSSVRKAVYIYGGLDRGPTVLDRTWGMRWSVGGWLLTPFLEQRSAVERAELRNRIADGIRTTFASHYADKIALSSILDPETIARIALPMTGQKYVIDPHGSVLGVTQTSEAVDNQ